ncbi:MAG: hypothetical protein GXO25_06715 [Euryarchaeota archaeon]|uniref:Uncharacterized protein n=1 Tax=uncultured euryarchaeote Alv-FOS4 TaxID=337893 RepID=Q3SA79_9EURY|nr:hypothetical protein [uncultured euryarchaeote Alv-FOS4]NPA75756.1 hypothetical protein [Euryarchaeota archaeon]
MKLLRTIFTAIAHSLVYIGIPLALIYALNANYPGLLEARYVRFVHIAILLGIPIVVMYALADLTSGIKSMIFEIIALVLVIIYTFMILGMGSTELTYQNVKIYLFYPVLLYIVILGIAIRFPSAVFKYLAEREQNPPSVGEV